MKTTKLTLPGENEFFTEEAFKVLRTNLQFCGQDTRVIGVTSSIENEGKTTITLHTAKSFSELGKKILVIDADMRKSVIAGHHTDITETVGLSEVLSGLEKFEDCIYQTQNESLHILMAGKYPPNPVELINSEYFTRLIERVRKEYDYVFIDTPPIGAVIDAAVISKSCDGMVLVLKNACVHYKQAQMAVDQLKKTGCRILGVVRNEIHSSHSGKYYSKYKYKNSKYGYGYGQKPASDKVSDKK